MIGIITYSKQTKSLSIWQWILLLLIPVFLWGCYWYVEIPYYVEKIIGLSASVALIIFFFIYGLPSRSQGNGRLLKFFLLLSFVSIVNAYFYWGQSLGLTFSASFGLYSYIYYFLLEKWHVRHSQIIKILAAFFIIYAVFWLYAFSQAPDVIFGNAEEIKDNRGMFRISIYGEEFLHLFFFYLLTKYLNNKTNILILIALVIASFLVFATLSRMVIGATAAVTFFYVIRKQSWKTVLVVVAIILALFGYIMQNTIVQNLIELQETQTISGKDEIIRSEYEDCVRLYPFHVGTFLFGNGADHIASSYGKREDNLKTTYDFNRSDAGFPGLYVTYGILAVVLFVLIFIKVIRQKVPDELYYYKLYIIYFLITSITTNYFTLSAIGLSITLYSLDKFTYPYNNKKSLCF